MPRRARPSPSARAPSRNSGRSPLRAPQKQAIEVMGIDEMLARGAERRFVDRSPAPVGDATLTYAEPGQAAGRVALAVWPAGALSRTGRKWGRRMRFGDWFGGASEHEPQAGGREDHPS